MSKIDASLWEQTSTSGSALQIKIGPQVVRIMKIEDAEDKQYIKLYVDVVQGEYKDIFKQQAERFEGEWPVQGIAYRSYKPTAYSFLKAFVTAVEKSNPGYDFVSSGYNFNTLVNKLVVAVFGEEEYETKDKEIATNIKIVDFRSVIALQEGKIKTPEKKTISQERKKEIAYHNAVVQERTSQVSSDSFTSSGQSLASEEDLPF